MTVATASAPISGIPGRTAAAWQSRGALIALLVTALAVTALSSERGEAMACDGAPLTVAEATLPDLTRPA